MDAHTYLYPDYLRRAAELLTEEGPDGLLRRRPARAGGGDPVRRGRGARPRLELRRGQQRVRRRAHAGRGGHDPGRRLPARPARGGRRLPHRHARGGGRGAQLAPQEGRLQAGARHERALRLHDPLLLVAPCSASTATTASRACASSRRTRTSCALYHLAPPGLVAALGGARARRARCSRRPAGPCSASRSPTARAPPPASISGVALAARADPAAGRPASPRSTSGTAWG